MSEMYPTSIRKQSASFNRPTNRDVTSVLNREQDSDEESIDSGIQGSNTYQSYDDIDFLEDENAACNVGETLDEPIDPSNIISSKATKIETRDSNRKKNLEVKNLERLFKYDITIAVGSTKNAGNFSLTLFGQRYSSCGLVLYHGDLESGSSVTFYSEIQKDLGIIENMIIEQNKDDPDWFCEKVTVNCTTTDTKQTFICERWLSNTRPDGLVRRRLYRYTEKTVVHLEEAVHIITVSTGNKRNAGTDANVFIIFHGKEKSSNKILLTPHRHARGESYTCSTTISFEVTCVEIGHDNTGESPDWFCDNVTVICQQTGVKQVFKGHKWFSKIKGDGCIVRTFYEQRDINSKVLHEMCKKYGRKSTEVAKACEDIKRQIVSWSPSLKDVLPTYRPAAPDSIVFVIFIEKGTNTKFEFPHPLETFDFVYRTIGEYSEEDSEVCKTERHYSFRDQNDKKKLTDILQKNSYHYMNEHSNLNIMTASPVKSKGFAFGPHRVENKPCIVFIVRVKGFIPIQEEELTSKIGIYKTDVREGEFKLYNEPEQYLQRLKIGCSIGEDTNNSQLGGTGGTLGAFVDISDGIIGCITSAHTLFSEDHLAEIGTISTKRDNESTNSTIYQPAPTLVSINEYSVPFGYVSSAVYNKGGHGLTGVEVGLITITDKSRNPENGKFPRVAEGFTIDTELNYTSGKIHTNIPDHIGQCTVYKYGAKTGLTRGAFKLSGGAVRQTGSTNLYSTFQTKCELHNQIEICSLVDNPVVDQNQPQPLNFKHFAEPGDSGALVLLETKDTGNARSDLRAIGILTGGATNCAVFYVTPILEILRALKLPPKLKNFDGQTNMETAGDAFKSQGLENTNKTVEGIKRDANVEEKIGILNNEVGAKVGKMEESISMVENQVAIVNEKIEKVEQNVKEIIKNDISNVNEKIDKISSDMVTKTDMKDLATKTDMKDISNVLQILLKASITQVNTTQSNLTPETNTQTKIIPAVITE